MKRFLIIAVIFVCLPINVARSQSKAAIAQCVQLIETLTPYTSNVRPDLPGRAASEEEGASVSPVPATSFVEAQKLAHRDNIMIIRYGDEQNFVYVALALIRQPGKPMQTQNKANVTMNGTPCGTWEVNHKK